MILAKKWSFWEKCIFLVHFRKYVEKFNIYRENRKYGAHGAVLLGRHASGTLKTAFLTILGCEKPPNFHFSKKNSIGAEKRKEIPFYKHTTPNGVESKPKHKKRTPSRVQRLYNSEY